MPCTNHGSKCDGAECANKNLDNGLMTRLWGPSGWLFLHCVSFGYPYKIDPTNPEHIEKQNDYYRFFYYLGKVMPCKYCRNSYMDFFSKMSPMSKLGSRKEFTKWLYDIHNMVNEKLGVPQCEIPTFEEIEERYQSFRASCAPLTEQQRANNSVKGCVVPADGKPKRSVIKVVEYSPTSNTSSSSASSASSTPAPTQGTTTTVANTVGSSPSPPSTFPKSDDYFILNKKTVYIGIAMLICLIMLIIVNTLRGKY